MEGWGFRRDGHETSESTVGRILKTLMDQGAVTPVPSLRRNRPRAARRARPYARRLPKGRKASAPGEIVQLDTLTVSSHPGQPAIKQFTACDPVAKWTCAQAWRRATAHNANVRRACAAPPGPRSRLTLDKLQADMPFPPRPHPSRPGRWRLRVQGRLRNRMPAPRHHAVRTPSQIARTRRTRRAQQRRLAIRVLRHMGPHQRRPRRHRPVDRRLRRRVRHLPTAPGPWRTNPSTGPCSTRSRRNPHVSYGLNENTVFREAASLAMSRRAHRRHAGRRPKTGRAP